MRIILKTSVILISMILSVSCTNSNMSGNNAITPGFDKKTSTYFSGLDNTTQEAVMYLLTYLLS